MEKFGEGILHLTTRFNHETPSLDYLAMSFNKTTNNLPPDHYENNLPQESDGVRQS